jgi:hypothetical protein
MNSALRTRMNQARKNTAKGKAIKAKTKNWAVRSKLS